MTFLEFKQDHEKIKIRWLRYMDVNVREVLEAYRSGKISAEEAEKALRMDYMESIEDHTVFDHARSVRKNMPEVVYASSKSPETVAEIAEHSSERAMLISRASEAHYEAVKKRNKNAVYVKRAEMIVIGEAPKKRAGKVGIITAGTSDIKVAEEAKIMAEFMGCECIARFDVGVAGLHRILEPMKTMLDEDVDCIVVAAGMEGALPALVASLTVAPVIGVPTSTGYGMGGKGEAALMSMLQTCSPGLTVVNIDNGIGAGAAAALIARRKSEID